MQPVHCSVATAVAILVIVFLMFCQSSDSEYSEDFGEYADSGKSGDFGESDDPSVSGDYGEFGDSGKGSPNIKM